ncbi:hypothetical protein SNK03_004923 [Fusarium graminearum]|uniref:Chromosome 2, complete genome n=1 Tax=Gibberella zeae (strain ATCC MYA-4620 / CBS 123657 / FGSC 9075 / NRRL 31084 / PH-1) TaxID=229533 RepID=I1S901_GIBZE|nr:hypothetical protein FGSG_13331 [Fusarium graminearum PH-1]ESU14704.1 hypothetical protein FGSG_13331 [Fusarium graminearum PH-1]EYB29432.1 hypothetical protein FG05_13331 [Fusarium graminearum]CEF77000.1 unnamed protein product [Fusarium graminearum]CZS80292.1 unnamed protein product [Fusarium graminearum]|eukprot:XP_011320129.1 hypothetical protein FGSG_13331 [Fusarium graminearum PH-1]
MVPISILKWLDAARPRPGVMLSRDASKPVMGRLLAGQGGALPGEALFKAVHCRYALYCMLSVHCIGGGSMTGTIFSEDQGSRSPGTAAWMDAVAVEGFLVSFPSGTLC